MSCAQCVDGPDETETGIDSWISATQVIGAFGKNSKMSCGSGDYGNRGKDGGRTLRPRLLTAVWRRFAAKGSRKWGGTWWGDSGQENSF